MKLTSAKHDAVYLASTGFIVVCLALLITLFELDDGWIWYMVIEKIAVFVFVIVSILEFVTNQTWQHTAVVPTLLITEALYMVSLGNTLHKYSDGDIYGIIVMLTIVSCIQWAFINVTGQYTVHPNS